jgi:hypothetical protein
MSKLNFPERLALVESKGFTHGRPFVLAEEVPNPTPDRRHSHDWRKLPNIPAGKRFRVVEEFVDTQRKEKLWSLEPCNARWAVSHRIKIWLDADAALWDAIVPNLVPDVRTFDDLIWRADDVAQIGAEDLLVALIEKKRITFADLDALIDELHLEAVRKERAS